MNLMGCGLVLGNILWSLRSREKGEEVPAEPCFERHVPVPGTGMGLLHLIQNLGSKGYWALGRALEGAGMGSPGWM